MSIDEIADAVKKAAQNGYPLHIKGNSTKAFYGHDVEGQSLTTTQYHGIVEYDPTELFITARAGTSLSLIEQQLNTMHQMLPFEPPYFGAQATFGGTIATGLSGPRRPYSGSIKDCILGMHIMDGIGNYLRFGGKVIKNVAGYDVSRLMSGSLGTLGIITQITCKVLPRRETEKTVVVDCDLKTAIQKMNAWAQKPFPISATVWDGNNLYIRLSGTAQTVDQCAKNIGGDSLDRSKEFWISVREHTNAFFMSDQPLWRISVPPATFHLPLAGQWMMEWNGGLRWLRTEEDPAHIHSVVSQYGGHGVWFKNHSNSEPIFPPLSPELLSLHKALKRVFDPKNILNPGKIYRDL